MQNRLYIAIVVWAAWDFDTLFSNYAQPFAFAGLLATLLQMPYYPKLDIVEKSLLCYSTLINLVVLFSGYVIGGELIYIAQCWLLATVVVGWIHVRLYSIRNDSIRWLLNLGKLLYWLGMIGAVCGFSAFPIFLTKAGGMANLLFTAIMINVGIYGSLAVSIALSLELLSTPTPNRLRMAVGYATCLIWVILFTTWCYLQ